MAEIRLEVLKEPSRGIVAGDILMSMDEEESLEVALLCVPDGQLINLATGNYYLPIGRDIEFLDLDTAIKDVLPPGNWKHIPSDKVAMDITILD